MKKPLGGAEYAASFDAVLDPKYCMRKSAESGYSQCGNPPKVTRDGTRYCGTHDPVKSLVRELKRDLEYIMKHRTTYSRDNLKYAIEGLMREVSDLLDQDEFDLDEAQALLFQAREKALLVKDKDREAKNLALAKREQESKFNEWLLSDRSHRKDPEAWAEALRIISGVYNFKWGRPSGMVQVTEYEGGAK